MAVDLLTARPALRPAPPPEAGEPRHDLDYLTNFERKFRKEGRPIWRACYERVEVLSEEGVASPPVARPSGATD